MTDGQQKIEKMDIVKSFDGGSLKYRVPHVYDINGKEVKVDYAFVLQEDGRNKTISLNGLMAIKKALDEDTDLQDFLAHLPKKKSL